MIEIVSRAAELSPCGRYRYMLSRSIAAMYGRGTCVFVMLNPSTADHEREDQTIRQCLGFVEHWGYSRLVVVNLFAWRATLPRDMLAAIDPEGVDNDGWLLRAAAEADQIICAWGAHGRHRDRGAKVRAFLQDAGFPVFHLGLTAEGQPRHPLYLKRDTARELWT